MSSVTSISGTSTSSSSIYGSKNVISGLASGLDTESMIQNSVSGYNQKITSLQQSQQMLQWKQDAYRTLIDKMVALTQKYTSYTSKTNLFSQSFFTNAVTTTANGANAALASATGKTNSAVQLDAIKQLATAAKYTVGANSTSLNTGSSIVTDASGAKLVQTTGSAIDLSGTVTTSTISGSMSINYGNRTLDLSFGELDTYSSAEELAKGIEEKLAGQSITLSDGSTVKANTRIKVEVSDSGEISLSDKSDAGNSVYISSASDSMKNVLGIEPGENATSFTVGSEPLTKDVSTIEYLGEKTVSVNLNGTTKQITIPTLTESSTLEDLAAGLNSEIASKFGSGKLSVSVENGGLSFSAAYGSTFSVTSSIGEALGLGDYGVTSYLNTSNKLGTLLGSDAFAGGEKELVVNGVSIGKFGEDTTLESVMLAINSSSAGVSVSYSKLTNEFLFTAKETGEGNNINMSGDLAGIFGFNSDGSGSTVGTATSGQDAIFTATVNGTTIEMSRSTNVVNLDGLSVTLNGTFGYEGDNVVAGTEPITFTTKSDTDTIVSAIKEFVNDYNALVTELRSTYTTMPSKKSDGSKYKPLTDTDKESMSESAIAAYEAKVKQGLLFGDNDLSSLYNKLRSAIAPGGSDSAALSAIGITTSYSQGLTTLSLDTDALVSALESNPSSVADVFSKTVEGGAGTNGLMYNIKTTLEAYSSTSLATPGILVSRAGTTLSSNSLLTNALQKEYDQLSKQIESWQTKLSSKVDYYTKQFSALEQLISKMNSQSSMLSGLTSGY